MDKIIIDKEFKNLIPVLTSDEFSILEQSCINNGIQDSIKIWNDIIIDGHNRYKIAQLHNLKFNTESMEFESRANVIEWMLINQLGRRNLNNYDRSLIALKLEEIYKVKGIENKSKAGKKLPGRTSEITEDCQISDKVDTKKIIAEKAKVSHDTITKVKHIEQKASPEVKEKLKSGEITINKAFNDIKKEEKRQEIKEKSIDKEVENESIDIYNTTNKYRIEQRFF